MVWSTIGGLFYCAARLMEKGFGTEQQGKCEGDKVSFAFNQRFLHAKTAQALAKPTRPPMVWSTIGGLFYILNAPQGSP